MLQKRWAGRAVIAIAALHTVVSVALFSAPYLELVERGLWDSVGMDEMSNAAVWFLFAGFFMFTTGWAIDRAELANDIAGLKVAGWTLLAIAILGIILMPASGFWLILVPAIALLWKKAAES